MGSGRVHSALGAVDLTALGIGSILGTASCFIQMIVIPWETWVRLVAGLAVALAIYFAYGRARAAEYRGAALRASAAARAGAERRSAADRGG